MAGPYDFHVMMRVEIEAALLNGSLAARDLPEVWRKNMGTNLDLEVPSDREGCPARSHPGCGRPGGNMAGAIGETSCWGGRRAARSTLHPIFVI